MAESANAEARFNAPPHQSELNEAVLGNVPDHLGFKARDQIKSAIKSVDTYRLTTKKPTGTGRKFGEKAIWMNISWHETSENMGASAKSSIQLKMGGEKLKRFMAGNVQYIEMFSWFPIRLQATESPARYNDSFWVNHLCWMALGEQSGKR